MIVSVSTNQRNRTHPSNCQFVKQKLLQFYHEFSNFLTRGVQFVLRTDTIWLVFKEPLTISRAQRDLYRGVREAQGLTKGPSGEVVG